jgi:hypothetical protein
MPEHPHNSGLCAAHWSWTLSWCLAKFRLRGIEAPA